MTVGFEPSVEMIEAGARALCETASDGIDNYDDLNDVAQEMFREWSEANLRAALGLVLSDPCALCEGTGDDHDEPGKPCPWCRDGKVNPEWAWLRAAQNSGVMEPVGIGAPEGGPCVDGNGPASGWWLSDSLDASFYSDPDAVSVFRVSVPEEGT